MNTTEATSRIKINKLLEETGWDLQKDVNPEAYIGEGFIDYLLLNPRGLPIAVLEAKSEKHDPLDGKYQAEKYAKAKKCRFIILSNGEEHYFWDTSKESERPILRFPTQKDLEKLQYYPRKKKLSGIILNDDFIVKSQGNVAESEKRFLRDYQMAGLQAIMNAYDNRGKREFLLEMATGTGKTLLAAAIIKLFLKSGNAQKVLFLVDRIELAQQAKQNLEGYLTEYTVCIFKEKKDLASSHNIIIATVQSLGMNANYRKYFSPFEFDLLFSDEAHRSIYGTNKVILEYFEAIKIGLTATPKDYLKNLDVEKLRDEDPRKLEARIEKDTYQTFGCESEDPTFRFSLQKAVQHEPPYLVNPVIYDKRSDKTTKLLSEKGWSDVFVTDEGLEVEETFKLRALERKVFSDSLNRLMASEFLKVAQKDPLTGEIGKTIIYCISQKHAEKIVQLLNQFTDKLWPNKYKGTFARRITSNVVGSQDLSKRFRNNKLGNTRIVATVSMMTTGYDCPDLLNIAFMRPVFSPTEFIQMKGRGTRRFTFTDEKSGIKIEKQNFNIVDFFAVCEYFEEVIDYLEPMKLSVNKVKKTTGDIDFDLGEILSDLKLPIKSEKYVYLGADGIILDKRLIVDKECMKIDREMYRDKFEQELKTLKIKDSHFDRAIKESDFDTAQLLVEEKLLNRPEYFFTLESLRRAYAADNTLVDFIKKGLGVIDKLPSKYDRIDEEFQRLRLLKSTLPSNKLFAIKEIFTNYLADKDYRQRLESQDYSVIADPTVGGTLAFGDLEKQEIQMIVSYIKENNIQTI